MIYKLIVLVFVFFFTGCDCEDYVIFECEKDDAKVIIVQDYPNVVHNGIEYGVVTSLYTGKLWLDRNIGASRVCISHDDTQCFGDYYQWGRESDGHEKSNSLETTIQATSLTNVGDKFITDNYWEHNLDWAYDIDPDGSQRSFNWSKIDGTSVCPIGYRVPTGEELKIETIDEGVDNKDDAFNNFLKFPSAGDRIGNGILSDSGSYGFVWTTIPGEIDAQYFTYNSGYSYNDGYSYLSYGARDSGNSVRCIKD